MGTDEQPQPQLPINFIASSEGMRQKEVYKYQQQNSLKA